MQYLVLAYDGTDAEAPARRQAVRESHLEGVHKLKADGHILTGGAILDDDGGMVGSAVIVEFEDRTALDDWLRGDPYVTGKVWLNIEVRPFRVAL